MEKIDFSSFSDVSLDDAEYQKVLRNHTATGEYEDFSSESDFDTDLLDKIEIPVLDVKNRTRKTGPILYAIFYIMGAVIILTSSTFGFIRNKVFHVFGIENNSYSSGVCFGHSSVFGDVKEEEEEDCYKYDDVV